MLYVVRVSKHCPMDISIPNIPPTIYEVAAKIRDGYPPGVSMYINVLPIYEVDPKRALEDMGHISERTFHGTVFTIEDKRYKEFHGRQILQKLVQGNYRYEWIKRERKR